ncbi:aminopeptidase N, partial [Alphaproteobacteria bacterium]|nr:aminopeptidase N [Alphaproteobacteria bacterium]
MKTLVKKREDYKPLFWVPKKTFLDIYVQEDFTIVKSEVLFNKNQFSIIEKYNLESVIELNGVNLETLKFELLVDNDKPTNILKNKIKKRNEVISIKVSMDANFVKILSEVKIYPKKNTSLEGLFESNQMLCTQCEPEGFRKITWFPDRPDCLSIFTVRVEVPKYYNTVLSNGNLIKEGSIHDAENKTERQFKIWHDPFPKPSYLFALVIGNLEVVESSFITSSNNKIKLMIYTEYGNKHLTGHAMKSLKNAMSWDEEKYGLEYDLKSFMIVAVSHFNMGAMENKGLNIFNSKFILADTNTATDNDLKNIESIVAHEYFHNWTGNRVTCRDWFQLTLKEGLTVFRDQEFSGDMNDKGVKRIEDVLLLKTIQFPEDAGSNCHPIRPNDYIEINNFYTPTVYEKGAEIIRMIFNFLGEKKFRKGMDVYFNLFDGKAVTCEDFLYALSNGSKLELEIFKKWYGKSGTPNLNIKRKIENSKYYLNLTQSIKNKSSDLPIPIKLAFLNNSGNLVKFRINNSSLKNEHVYLLSKSDVDIEITSNDNDITPSILRGFSAPITLNTDLTINEYLHILKFDNDSYNKWDAIQNLYLECFKNSDVISLVISTLGYMFSEENFNSSLMSFLLELPSRNSFENLFEVSDPIDIYQKRRKLIKTIGINLLDIFEKNAKKVYRNNININKKNGERALFGKLLNYLVLANSELGLNLAKSISTSGNMTLSILGLKALCLSN